METAYEAIYLVNTSLPDEQMTAILDKYSGVVARSGGTVDDVDRWDPRRLAFEVKGRREGVYVVMNFRSEPAAKNELDRIFRISDDVLRHMVIQQDVNADRFPSRTRSAESDRREREMAARMAAAPPPPPAQEPVTELVAAPVVDQNGTATSAGLTEEPAPESTIPVATEEPSAEETPNVEPEPEATPA